jgi:hypothetical protein
MAHEPSNTDTTPAVEEERAGMQSTPSDDFEKALGDSAATKGPTDEQDYPPMRKVILIMISLYMAIFLVSLVR